MFSVNPLQICENPPTTFETNVGDKRTDRPKQVLGKPSVF